MVLFTHFTLFHCRFSGHHQRGSGCNRPVRPLWWGLWRDAWWRVSSYRNQQDAHFSVHRGKTKDTLSEKLLSTQLLTSISVRAVYPVFLFVSFYSHFQAPLTNSDTAVLSGSLSTHNGNGGGNINMTVRRVTSAKGWGEVRTYTHELHSNISEINFNLHVYFEEGFGTYFLVM